MSKPCQLPSAGWRFEAPWQAWSGGSPKVQWGEEAIGSWCGCPWKAGQGDYEKWAPNFWNMSDLLLVSSVVWRLYVVLWQKPTLINPQQLSIFPWFANGFTSGTWSSPGAPRAEACRWLWSWTAATQGSPWIARRTIAFRPLAVATCPGCVMPGGWCLSMWVKHGQSRNGVIVITPFILSIWL